jgi:hypothetical protein
MSGKPKLKVTGLTGMPPGYKGEPCVMSINIIDKKGGVYEADIHFDAGITADRLRDAMVNIFNCTDYVATKVNIKAIKIKTNGTE